MKTINYVLLIILSSIVLISCNKDHGYEFPEVKAFNGDITAIGDPSTAITVFDWNTHRTITLPGYFNLEGTMDVEYLKTLDSDASYFKILSFTNKSRESNSILENEGELFIELNLQSINGDGMYFSGPMYLIGTAHMAGEFKIGHTFGRLVGASGSINVNGEVFNEERIIEIIVTGFISNETDLSIK